MVFTIMSNGCLLSPELRKDKFYESPLIFLLWRKPRFSPPMSRLAASPHKTKLVGEKIWDNP
jgi:hypothetical protein